MRDILYGSYEIPQEIEPFLRLPEFVRLRGVRLSNVDSIQFKDLNGATRWEHSIGVLHLASVCARARSMPTRDRNHLLLAALLHDVATPPFAHTGEYVLADFDHELESSRLLAGSGSRDVAPGATVYLSEVAQFRDACRTLSRTSGITIDPDEVARMVIGEGDLGYLISGTLDLDNADNVTRASLYMGFDVDRRLPVRLAEHLATCDGPPLELEQSPVADIREWVEYRKRMYRAFYESSSSERGREAALQHLFRRALALGVPRHSLVWNTDDGLLAMLERFTQEDGHRAPIQPIRKAVQRYRLLEEPRHVLTLDLSSCTELRVLQSAAATEWIEAHLSSESCESFVTVAARRFRLDTDEDGVVPPAAGQFHWFKSGSSLKHAMLPDWLRREVPDAAGATLVRHLQGLLARRLTEWAAAKPWNAPSAVKTERARDRLEELGDWSFRQSRNVGLHTYPSTFVQAIPATLIHALGVAGETIVDPFGGIGNTALEAVRAGGWGVSGDSNSIATLIARVRSTYLTREQREFIGNVSTMPAVDYGSGGGVPSFPLIEKWHHARTAEELADIKHFVESVEDAPVRRFLTVAFSAILPNATARRGEQHGFFADSTPLPRDLAAPPYIDAHILFAERVKRNLAALENSFAGFERDEREARVELSRMTVVRQDVCQSDAGSYGIAAGSASAVITSPPYLGMSDYTLGHRLSYGWLLPDRFESDFSAEIGARRLRLRMRSEDLIARYLAQLGSFADLAHDVLRPGGFLAMVIGKPVARAFVDHDILGMVDSLLEERGFAPVWHTWRPISWSRNHGYAKLKSERISVHQLREP